MKKDYSKLWTLFKSMFVLSACTFGGGFVIVSLMKKRYVEELKWMEEDEMLDVTAITQSAPGPLPVMLRRREVRLGQVPQALLRVRTPLLRLAHRLQAL